ncbi:DUF202 domain-containing protein [Primorskyibacter sp. 2E233]|uniref:DUF202 domain-containing protein n=1 Tax=Primorskyibacter sp. 2E233 TaxID=3413431 RepID=UPI003BF04281
MILHYNDHAANERTFLAWVRTAISVVAFGLALPRLQSAQSTTWSEVLLLLTGGLVILLAYIRMHTLRSQIAAKAELDDKAMPRDIPLLLLVIALFSMLISFVFQIQ